MGVILVASHPLHGERRFTVESEARVGSAPASDLKLEPPVEAQHARFIYRDGRLIIVDLRTANGTFVNGTRIVQATIVRLGQEVSVGDWAIRIDDSDRPETPFVPKVDRERELLEGLQANPADDELRQVYGDWLEEAGRTKEAEVLSLEREIRDEPLVPGRITDAGMGRLGYRLRTLAADLPFSWRAVVTRPRIENCRSPEQCPRTWDQLNPTASLVVRHCGGCGQVVHLAETMEIARHHVGQNHRVAVDVSVDRYPRDLEVALARLPPVPAAHEGGVTSLPFFSTDEPPGTVGAILRSLNLVPPEELGQGANMGFFSMPNIFAESASPPSPLISSVSIRYRWDMYHEDAKTHFSQIEHTGYEDFSISFFADGDLIENWLRSRFGPPREAVEPSSDAEFPATSFSVYGHWLFREWGNGGGFLRWESRLPDWALAPTDKNVALRFLHELAQLLRRDPIHAEIVEFASRPPPRSGLVVRGPMNRNDFWFILEPKLTAFDVAHALEISSPIGTSGDVHMSSWSIQEQNSRTRLGYPQYGNWVIEVNLDGWPSGGEVEGRYAAKHLSAKDRVHSLCIRPFEP